MRRGVVVLVGCGRLGFEPPASPVDAVEVATVCPASDSETLALYAFDAPTATDALGAHDGAITAGTGVGAPGPDGCGNALRIAGGAHVRIPDSNAWDSVASIDFWIRFASTNVYGGILSRDAGNQNEP